MTPKAELELPGKVGDGVRGRSRQGRSRSGRQGEKAHSNSEWTVPLVHVGRVQESSQKCRLLKVLGAHSKVWVIRDLHSVKWQEMWVKKA